MSKDLTPEELTQARTFRKLVGQDGHFPFAPFDLISHKNQYKEGGSGEERKMDSFKDEPLPIPTIKSCEIDIKKEAKGISTFFIE